MSHHHDNTRGDTTADDVAPLAYSFDAEHHRDPQQLIELLGGKGCGLAVMSAMDLPVPPGFTLTTEACRLFDEDGWTDELDLAVRAGLAELEHTTGARLGDAEHPLLVSVRSGAEVSMPGMMDTVLDVGMTDAAAAGLARSTGDDDFAADTCRRALASYAAVVFAAPPEAVSTVRRLRDVEQGRAHLAAYGLVVPRDPVQQVIAAVQAVFRSWASPRAEHYRRIQGIDDALGTAATIQAMVFGNLGPDSGTGVAFTRDPSTGRCGLVGDFLVHAQGEDVVAGDRATGSLVEMEHRWPDTWTELVRIADALEREFADMVDIEFTVERGRLWILQARRGKRSAAAAMRIAVDMADDPDFPLDRRAAVERCGHLFQPVDRDQPQADRAVDRSATVLASGMAASPGRAAGALCVDIDDAVRRHEAGAPVVLVRRETSPADVQGMAASVGLVTTLGGLVSHAAVVARSWGIPAVVGASDLTITDDGVLAAGTEVRVGEVVTVDGDGGRLLLGDHGADTAEPPEADILRSWAADLAGG